MTRMGAARRAATAYLTAKHHVLRMGFAHEVDWQEDVCLGGLTESRFLEETAWVILCSGMRESVVRQRFEDVSAAFCFWESAGGIVSRADQCRTRALRAFRHAPKIDAILEAATYLVGVGIDQIRIELAEIGPRCLQRLRFIGPVTSLHLAKNLGAPVAKPDRHLIRISAALGYDDVHALCADVASLTCDPVPVIDLVLWRFATQRPDYLRFFEADLDVLGPDHHLLIHTTSSPAAIMG